MQRFAVFSEMASMSFPKARRSVLPSLEDTAGFFVLDLRLLIPFFQVSRERNENDEGSTYSDLPPDLWPVLSVTTG